MKIQELQALINGQIQPEQICIEQLVALARQHIWRIHLNTNC